MPMLALCCLILATFVVVPLAGGAFLLLSAKFLRIENVSYTRTFLAYLAGYVAASIVCSGLMFGLVSASSGRKPPGIILWTSLPLPQFLLLFAIAIAVHMIVVPLILNTRYTRAVLAHGLAILMNSVVTGVVLAAVMIPFAQAARHAARRQASKINLNQIGIAMLEYDNELRAIPTAATYDVQGRALLSWRVHLLPYLGHRALYEQFRLDEPWDSPGNSKLLKSMPDVYQSPMSRNPDDSMTHYQVFVRVIRFPSRGGTQERELFHPRNPPFTLLDATVPVAPALLDSWPGVKIPTRLASIVDGLSNTIFVAEAGTAVQWTQPADIAYDPEEPLPILGEDLDNGFLVVLFDGAVRYFPADTAEEVIRAAIDHQGRERHPLSESSADNK